MVYSPSEVLASQAFLGVLERVTGIPRLLADPLLEEFPLLLEVLHRLLADLLLEGFGDG